MRRILPLVLMMLLLGLLLTVALRQSLMRSVPAVSGASHIHRTLHVR